MKRITTLLLAISFFACSDDDPEADNNSIYFPPTGTSAWETVTPESLGWDESAVPALESFLSNANTRAFIVLKNGRIVMEMYMNNTIANTPFNASSAWYWASAGKALTSALVGIAEAQDKIDLDASTSSYLGNGWTSLPSSSEDKIKVRHHITMTTGIDDGVVEPDCTNRLCLQYKAEPGTRWAYHNAPYTILDNVITAATGQNFETYFNEQLRNKIGMDGSWQRIGLNNVYISTPRSMARFGLLLLNKGKWNDEQVIPEDYFNDMVNTSQSLNLSYGYLTWLNGKASAMAPQTQVVFQRSIAPNAPAEMFAAIGRNGQIINVVPSQQLVVIRMGDVPDTSLVPFSFQDDLWKQLKLIIKE